MAPTTCCKKGKIKNKTGRKRPKKETEGRDKQREGGEGEPGFRAGANDIPETCSRRGAAVCVLGPEKMRREGKRRERLCAWEPDLLCFWFHWGERKSESEWYHDIVLVLFFNVALRLGVYLWGCFGPPCTALLWFFFFFGTH